MEKREEKEIEKERGRKEREGKRKCIWLWEENGSFMEDERKGQRV